MIFFIDGHKRSNSEKALFAAYCGNSFEEQSKDYLEYWFLCVFIDFLIDFYHYYSIFVFHVFSSTSEKLLILNLETYIRV
jgi:hypothetical protein